MSMVAGIKPCMVCEGIHTFEVDVPTEVIQEGLNRWVNGEFIQNAMPFLNADQREILISGTGPACWDEMFKDDDDDD